MRRASAVIFDLDGCLVDSELLVFSAIVQEMKSLGISDAHEGEIRDRFLGCAMSEIQTHVSMRLNRECPEDFPLHVQSRLFDVYDAELKLVPGVETMLSQLQADNIPMAIATGGSLARMQKTLECSGLGGFFSSTAFSVDLVRRGKPAPDIFLYAAEQLGIPATDCVVVEDSPHGVKGACEAGMRAIGFIGGVHLHGIRDRHSAVLAQAGAAEVIDSIESLAEAL